MRKVTRRVRKILFIVAGVQAVDGVLVAGTCLCSPSLRGIGSVVAFGLGAVVGGFCGLGFLARVRVRTAACLAALLEAAVVVLMGLPYVAASASAWAVQVPALLLVAAAVAFAFSEPAR